MLNLKKLRFRGIGRFVEEQIIYFDKLGSLIQVDATNNNTGGSSGSGKSTIFKALDFLFGLNTIPNTILQSRLTDEHMFVEGEFDLDNLPLIISRGKKLKIDYNGEVTTGSAKLSEEKLDQIISIPRNLFRPMLHKTQGERGFFLSFTPKETNDFLTDCLGFGNFKKHIIDLDVKIVELSKKTTSINMTLENNKSALKAIKSATEALGLPPVKEISQETVVALKQKMEASNRHLNEINAKQKKEIEELELTKPKITRYTFDYSIRKSLENELNTVKKEINQLHILEKDRQANISRELSEIKTKQVEFKQISKQGEEAKEKAAKIALEIKKLRENICFTCEQRWLTDTVKNKEIELLESIKKVKEIILAGHAATTLLDTINSEINTLTLQSKPQIPHGVETLIEKEKQLTKFIEEDKQKETNGNESYFWSNKAEQDTFDDKYQKIKNDHDIILKQAYGQSQLDSKTFDSAIAKMKFYEEARIRYENSINNLKNQEKDYSEQIDKICKELLEYNKNLSTMEEFKRAIKNYLSCSFDDALEDISNVSTKLVRGVPNMSNATIHLSGIRETKEGKLKEEVNTILHLDGDENIDIRSLSGGERASIDLAIDLSVIDLIETKTNKGINIYILDEPFNSLDTISIEMALEVLKNCHINKKLIIVDHNPEVKQMVENKLLVVRDGITSKIIQN